MLILRLRYWSLKAISLVGLTLMVFALPHLMPEPPATLYVAAANDPIQQKRLVAAYGFDRSLFYQYGRWIQRVITGKWGQSRFYPRQVAHEIWIATGRTLVLLMWTIVMLGFGLLCQRGWRRLQSRSHEPPSHSPQTTTRLVFFAVAPSFVIALVIRETLVWQVGWLTLAHLPTFAPNYLINPSYMIMPASALALPVFAIWLAASRPTITPSSRYRFAHWFRPFLGGFLLQVFLTEQVLSIRGLGMIGLAAFKRRDIPMVQGFLLGAGLLYLLLHLIIDWQSQVSTHQQTQTNGPLDQQSPSTPRRQLYSGLFGVVILVALAVWALALAPHDPIDIHSSDQLLNPGYRYLLGTDFLGRDILSRTLAGFRSTIPRALLIAILAGGLATLLLSSCRLLPHPVRQFAREGLFNLHIIPGCLLTFGAFLIFESRPFGLEIALVLGSLPLSCQLLTAPGSWAVRALRLFQISGQAVLLIAIFHLLSIVSDTSLPTWGADIRFGLTYSQRNIWLLLAPSIALIWSQYCFYALGDVFPPRHSSLHVKSLPDGDAAKTAKNQPEPSQN